MTYDITRTELVWPGKYNADGKRREVDRVSLPFQVIERVNESRASREADKARVITLFDFYEADSAETFEDGWRNKLIWGDNKLVLSSLFDQFGGKVDLIYIDPPFATGADFSFKALLGEEAAEVGKEQSVIEEKAYRDTWGRGMESYLEMLGDRLTLMRDLLCDTGSIIVHVDWRVSHMLRLVMNDIFGGDNFRNEIVWSYRTGGAPRKGFLPRKHDTLLLYGKTSSAYIRPLTERQYLGKAFMGSKIDANGRHYVDTILRDVLEGEIVSVQPEGSLRNFNTRPVLNLSGERLGYDTQKPEGLVSLLLEVASKPGDLVADFFVGSGTAAAAAEKSGRRWIACDLGRYAVHVTRKRLLEINDCKPFEVLNLGKYERKYWQVATFGEDLDDDGAISLYEYIAFILKLYGASPLAGMQHLHAKKGRAFVHVGAVDSPVTIHEIGACIAECVALKAKELHVLGWEWEMGLHDPMADEAAARGVQLVLRQIPREVMEEQAAAKGDVDFFELAYLDVEIKPTRRKLEQVAHLNNFVIPNPELVPDDVRGKIRKWSDYVDYWAVDWNFSDDTFHQGWVTYRTRKDRSLVLASDPHTYDGPGEYAVMVKVIDIFGNDTSTIHKIKVS